MGTLANSEDPDEMGLNCLLRLKQQEQKYNVIMI